MLLGVLITALRSVVRGRGRIKAGSTSPPYWRCGCSVACVTYLHPNNGYARLYAIWDMSHGHSLSRSLLFRLWRGTDRSEDEWAGRPSDGC